MKKYIILLVISLVAFSSCEAFLKEEPATKYPMEEYFNNEEEVLLYLYGCYYQVKNTVFGTDFMYLTDTMTDDVDYTSTNIARKGVAYLTLNSTNSLVKSVWGKFYALIEQCNIIIDQLEKNPGLSAANTKNIIAESQFMRAWAYYNLVMLWGDVPLVTKPVYNIAKDNILPLRSNKNDVLSFVIAELEQASTYLDEVPSAISVQSGINYSLTISRAAAKTLLAKVYQARGQWEEVIETLSYFMDGNTPKDNWGLCSHFNYIFDTRYETLPERKKEVLWEIEADGVTNLNNTWHREVAPSALKGPSGETIIGSTNGYQSYIPTYNLIHCYSQSDMRYLEGFQFSSGNRPQFMKGYDVQTLNQNLAGANVILLRTADAYLTLAEAYARLSNNAMARSLTDVVRARAGLAPLDASLSGDNLIDAIMLERRLEFAGEGAYRLYDLRRTGTYLQVMNDFNTELAALALAAGTEQFINPPTGKKTVAISIPFFSVSKNAQSKHLLLPIPADERINNPKLTQNPDWN